MTSHEPVGYDPSLHDVENLLARIEGGEDSVQTDYGLAHHLGRGMRVVECSSFPAALALLAAVLPGWDWDKLGERVIVRGPDGRTGEGRAAKPAAAMVAAILRARAELPPPSGVSWAGRMAFSCETYIGGKRWDAGEYEVRRIGERTDPEF